MDITCKFYYLIVKTACTKEVFRAFSVCVAQQTLHTFCSLKAQKTHTWQTEAVNNYNKLLQLRPHYLNAWNRLINHPTGLNIKCLGNSVMIKFPSHTELDLERVQTSCTGKQMKLTSEEKDLVQWPRSSTQSKKEDTTGTNESVVKNPAVLMTFQALRNKPLRSGNLQWLLSCALLHSPQ